MRRVAITGLGVISAAGTGTPAFFDALLSARSGIRAIDIPFPTGTESVLAGAIDFDPDPHFFRARLLTMDRVSQFALVAGREAMAQAGGILASRAISFDPTTHVMLFMAIDAVKFRKAVTPGDQLHIEVVPLRKGKIFKMKGEIRVDGNVVSSAEFLAGLAEKSKVS